MARGRHVARTPSQRISTWVGFTASAQTVAGMTAVLLGVANAALLALRPFTIVRTRGVFFVESDQAATTERSHGVFGAVVVEEEAADAGVASLPTPGTEIDAPFFLYEPYIHSFRFFDATGTNDPSGTTITFDSKAMRKVGALRSPSIRRRCGKSGSRRTL